MFANNLFEFKPSMHKTLAKIHTVKACQIMNSQACRQNNDKHNKHDKLGRGHGMSWSDDLGVAWCCSVGSRPDRSMQIAMTSCSDSSDSASGASGASGASAAQVAASVDAAGADGAGGASVPKVSNVPRVCECP